MGSIVRILVGDTIAIDQNQFRFYMMDSRYY